MVKLADWFTFSRVVLTPIVAVLWLASKMELRWIGVGLFIIAGLTDFVDGRIARHMKQTSKFGSYVDPLADKILVLGLASVLVYDHRISVWWFLVVLTRELAVTTLRSVLKPGTTMSASVPAKWKTVSQLFTLGAASVLVGVIPLVLVIISGLLTIWTGYEYIKRFWPAIET